MSTSHYVADASSPPPIYQYGYSNQFASSSNQFASSSNQFVPSPNQFVPSPNQFVPSPNQFVPSSIQFAPLSNQFATSPSELGPSVVETLKKELELLTSKLSKIEEQNIEQSKEINALKKNVEKLNLALYKQVFVDREEGQIAFDPSKIRSKCSVKVDYFDGPAKTINLVELIYNCESCKNGITSNSQIAELYRQMLFEVYGQGNIQYYSAAKSNQYTTIPKVVINGITGLIYDGFGLDSTGKQDNDYESIKRTEILMAVKQTNKNLFTNRRKTLKSSKRTRVVVIDSDEEVQTKKKKAVLIKKKQKKQNSSETTNKEKHPQKHKNRIQSVERPDEEDNSDMESGEDDEKSVNDSS